MLTAFVQASLGVDIVYPQSLTITGYEGLIEEGSTLQLQANPTPSNTTYSYYSWSSTNTSVATVNGNGLVTAVSEGTTTIKCVLSGFEIQYFADPYQQTATCTITVRKQTSADLITFADAEVKRICVENWDTNGDGELSYEEAAAVTELNEEFYNSKIVSFEEFKYFTGIKTIRGVGSSGNYMGFSKCSKLVKITLPETIEEIGDNSFYSDVSLKSINFPYGLRKIGFEAFRSCHSLEAITIPENVVSIGGHAFCDCYSVSSLYIPKNVRSIGSNITSTCGEAFASIIVDSNNPFYDSRNNCNAIIESATNKLISDGSNSIIPSSVTSLGDWVFYGRNATEIVIPQQITTIGHGAYGGCSYLESIILSPSLTTIYNEAFRYANKLKEVHAYTPSPIDISDGVFINDLSDVTLFVPKGCKSSYENADRWKDFKEIVEGQASDFICFVDAEVKRICVENWDSNSDGELSYEEAAAVKSIGEVFKGNTTITSFDELRYFTGMTSIVDRAFENCKSLRSLSLPEGLSWIGSGAFLYCDLRSIYIPASVAEIGIYAFVDNYNLSSIQVDAANTHYDSRNECNAIIETSTNTLIQGCKTTVIPSGIKRIGRFAFEFVDLKHIDLPQGLEEIGWCAFYGCRDLDEVVFPEGLKTMERFAYNGCTTLKNIVIPASVEYMGGGSFAGCRNIETLSVAPGGVAYISPDGSNAVVSKDGTKLVAGCRNTVIPESVVTIGSECFYDQWNLTSVSIPAMVTTIEDRAFCGCSSLTEIDIPEGVESIGEYAFSGCRIESVRIRRVVPIAITDDVFSGKANATLYVRKGCKAAYEAADYWRDFKEIVEMEAEEEEPSGPMVVTDISEMTDAIYIEPFSACIGSDVKMSICLKNAGAATAYVFDLVLPEGVTVATNDNGKYIDALSDRHLGHSRSLNYKGVDTYSLSALSLNSEEIMGNDGVIRRLTLHVADDMAEGVYAIKIRNASYSMPDGSLMELKNTTSSITAEHCILGDVNANDEVDIGDAVSIVNFLVGKDSEIFVEAVADTNKNGQVDIGDAVTIVNYLVGETDRLVRRFKTRDVKEPQ